ncbi:MAG: biopolymer transporter [Leptospiraceae bacterium]|nr:MAG: biopolymer transporter [Leptospiraceae bacterium]
MKTNQLFKNPLMQNQNLLYFIIFLFMIQFFTIKIPSLLSQEQEKVTQEQVQPIEQELTTRETILDWINKGGGTMYILGLISSIIIGFSLERYYFFKKSGAKIKNYYNEFSNYLESGLEELENFLKNDNRLISRILKEGIKYKNKDISLIEKQIENASIIEIGKLEKGLNLLSNLGNLAPLIGFFGTVVGMRNSFLQFVIKVAPTAKDLAGGVEEALITTQAGLLIAIPTYLIYNLFLYWIDSLSIEIERCGTLLINKIQEKNGITN